VSRSKSAGPHRGAARGETAPAKTTTLKAISNLFARWRGEVTKGHDEFAGKRVDKLSPNQLVRMGVCQVMEGGTASSTSPSKRIC